MTIDIWEYKPAGKSWKIQRFGGKKKSFPLLPGGSLPCVTLAGPIDGFRAPTAGELSTLLQLLVAYAHGCHWDWAWWSWGVGDGDNYEGSMKVLGP